MASPPVKQEQQQALQDALALHRAGKRDLAMQRYVGILKDHPENIDALYYVAVIGIQEGQIAEGVKVLLRALDIGPPQARLHNLLGQAYLRLNRDDDALASFERAIECEPGFVDAYGNRATLLSEMGRLDEALASFDQALALRSDNAEDWCNRATVLADLGRLPEAIESYDRAIVLAPQFAEALFNRADVQRQLGRLTDALASYDRAIALAPKMAQAHCNRGVTLKLLGRLDEAGASFAQALSLDPNFAEALANRANLAFERGRLEDAQTDYLRAIELWPDLAEAKFGRALVCLAQGDWETGFRLYDERERVPAAPYKPLSYQRWDGEPLNGERLVLLTEQGLGDTINFCRFGPLLAARGIDVTIQTSEALRPLLSTLQGVTIATAADAPAPNGRALRWLPLMSVPGAFKLKPDRIPAKVPYLAAEPQRIEAWRQKIGNGGFKIGINWVSGASGIWFAGRRDIPLAAFAPLAALSEVRLISLQKGPAAGQTGVVPFGDQIEVLNADLDPTSNLFLDTAAVMMQLDLIVSCDTSVPHLAGALARPVFLALPRVADWRWMRDRDDCPWYQTMRLFRQSTDGQWDDVLARIAAAVAELIKRR